MELIAVAGLEKVEEVVDQNDGLVAEPRQRDRRVGVVVGVDMEVVSVVIRAVPPLAEA